MFTFLLQEILGKAKLPIPKLEKDPSSITKMSVYKALKPTHIRIGNNLLQLAGLQDENDIWVVQELLRHQAVKHYTIGIDEFTQQGHFNCKLFWRMNTIIAQDTKGNLIGTALFGPSKFSRCSNSKICHIYVFIGDKKCDKSTSYMIASGILDICIKHITNSEMKYKGIVTDVYVNDYWSWEFYNQAGFLVTGTLPNIGIIKDHGPANSLLFYKQLSSV